MENVLNVVRSIQMKGSVVKNSLIKTMTKSSGNRLDDKCCHCGVFVKKVIKPSKK